MLALLITIDVTILGLKFRPNIIGCLDTWWIWKELKWPDSLSTPLPQIKFPKQTTLLIKRSRHSSFLFLSTGLHFPASSRNISVKPMAFSHSTQGLLTLSIPQGWPHSPCLFTLFSVQLRCTFVWHAVSSYPQMWAYVTNKLLPVSTVHVGCQMLPSPYPRVGVPPSPLGWIGGYQNSWHMNKIA